MLIGSGPLKEHIADMIGDSGLADNVIMLSQRSDVERLLKAIDVFLFPSLYEGLPVSLIEAQVSGLYCVVSNNVTNEAFLTSKVQTLSLSQSIDEWAQAVLNVDYIGKYNKNIYTFEMKEAIKNLEALYMK